MRISKTVSVSMPPNQLKAVERLAKKENRTLSELIREALRQYQNKQESPVNDDLIAALRAVQEDARKAGFDKTGSTEIGAKIDAYRSAQRQRRTKQPVE